MGTDMEKESIGERLQAYFCRIIPEKVGNRIVIWTLNMLTAIRLVKKGGRLSVAGKISKKVIAEHMEHNRRVLEDDVKGYYMTPGTYIENQWRWKEIQFGQGRQIGREDEINMGYAGCEIIAAYNALLALGENGTKETMTELISRFEKKGAVLGGIFGSSPLFIRKYFRQQGYKTRLLTGRKPEKLEKMGQMWDALILTAYNDKDDLSREIHTVCVTKEKEGYFIHNDYNEVYRKEAEEEGGRWYLTPQAKGPCRTMKEVMISLTNEKDRGDMEAAMISAIGICHRNQS